MSEDLVVLHCSPTLAGMKTGSLFVGPFDDIRQMRQCLRDWNGALNEKGLFVLCLRYRNDHALVFFSVLRSSPGISPLPSPGAFSRIGDTLSGIL